jgi:N-acetylglucosaminyldiphosphoundecaprenol N-acetyl-beta-D-mannosaminyltransferase
LPIPAFNVLGVAVHAMNLPVATAAIMDAVKARRKGFVCLAAVHGICEAQRDPALKRIYNRALLTATDGMPLAWLAKWRVGGGGIGRVYGPDLMLEVFRATQNGEAAHFLCGGAEGVAELLRRKLLARFPRARITGTWCPPFREPTDDDEKRLAEAVRAARPDIMWVGLGAPKQERFMARHLETLDATLMIGVGAAFDFHAGTLRQAPRWMRRCGLEWFFRLCVEPRRLWRRYLVCNPLFVLRTAGQLLGLKKYPIL